MRVGPGSLTIVGGKLFFAADDGVAGRELWKSDGTAAGTVLRQGHQSGQGRTRARSSSRPSGRHSSSAPTTAAPGSSSGRATARRRARCSSRTSIPAPRARSPPSALTHVGDTLFFFANDGSSGLELWKSDGTAAARCSSRTSTRAPAAPSPSAAIPPVSAGRSSSGPTTAARRRALEERRHGGGHGARQGHQPRRGLQRRPPVQPGVGRHALLPATDGVTGAELWKSDGTAAGTVLVKDINPGAGGSGPTNLASLRRQAVLPRPTTVRRERALAEQRHGGRHSARQRHQPGSRQLPAIPAHPVPQHHRLQRRRRRHRTRALVALPLKEISASGPRDVSGGPLAPLSFIEGEVGSAECPSRAPSRSPDGQGREEGLGRRGLPLIRSVANGMYQAAGSRLFHVEGAAAADRTSNGAQRGGSRSVRPSSQCCVAAGSDRRRSDAPAK